MKRCPTCQRTYEDDAQKFCANDGTPLVADETPAFDPEATVMSIPRPLLEEQPPVDAKPAPPLPPTQYFNQGAGQSSQPEQNVHQSYPPPPSTPTPGAPPSWPPAQQQQQQQPYYPQQGMAGGQPQAPQWQGGQPPQQGWTPGQSPQGQNWGGSPGGYYPQQPGQYAPYGAASAAGGSSKAGLAAMILGLISFIAIVAVFVIVSARMRDLRDIVEPLYWGSGVLSGAGLVLGIIALIVSKAGKAKAIIGMVFSIITLILFFLVYANMR